MTQSEYSAHNFEIINKLQTERAQLDANRNNAEEDKENTQNERLKHGGKSPMSEKVSIRWEKFHAAHAHFPDGDTPGSALALKLLLNTPEKPQRSFTRTPFRRFTMPESEAVNAGDAEGRIIAVDYCGQNAFRPCCAFDAAQAEACPWPSYFKTRMRRGEPCCFGCGGSGGDCLHELLACSPIDKRPQFAFIPK